MVLKKLMKVSLLSFTLTSSLYAAMSDFKNKSGKQIAEMLEQKNLVYKTESYDLELKYFHDDNSPFKIVKGKAITQETAGGKGQGKAMVTLSDKTKVYVETRNGKEDVHMIKFPGSKRSVSFSWKNSNFSKSSKFLGSEASVEDLTCHILSNYKHKFRKFSQGGKVAILEFTPKRKSYYTSKVYYIDTDKFVPIEIIYYKGSTKLKSMAVKEYKKYKVPGSNKTVYRPHRLEMKNNEYLRKNKKTLETHMVISNRVLNGKVSSTDLNPNKM